jgi:hypothetical protein
VVEAASAVEAETPARTFLSILGELIAFERVRIEGLGHMIRSDEKSEKDKIIGRLVCDNTWRSLVTLDDVSDEDCIMLSIPLALKAVQEQLRGQGRPQLQISTRTLLDQLTALELLLDDANQTIGKDQPGEKTTKTRIGGKSVNAARIKVKAFRTDWCVKTAPPSRAAGTTGMPAILPFSSGVGASEPALQDPPF